MLWRRICLTHLALGGALLLPTAALAQTPSNLLDTLEDYQDNPSMGQVTSVSELSDVSPSDWAFEALSNLVERYGCIEGYPDRTFRGNRALSRYEFAAGLNACMNSIERLIANSEAVLREDIAALQRLIQEFEAELASLGARVDNLEGRVAFLEDHQFSTTTKLRGQVSFAIAQAFGDEKADGSGDLDSQVVFNNRVRLFFETSFNGTDKLITRLDALNTVPFGPGEGDDPNITGTSMTRTAFDEGSDNSVRIGKLFYGFTAGKINTDSHDDHSHGDHEGHSDHDDHGDHGGHGGHEGHGHGPAPDARLSVSIDAVGGEFNENFVNFNEFFSEELTGAISRFGRFNPIYYQGLEGTGVSATYRFNETFSLSAGYLAPDASDPSQKAGLFNGSHAALAQFTIEPGDRLALGLTYARSYFPGGGTIAVSGETGSEAANAPFGEDTATSANSLGFQTSFQISPSLVLSGWAGLAFANAETSGFNDDAGVDVGRGDSATALNWALTLAWLDVGAEGNLLGLIVGQPPRVTDNDAGEESDQASWHLEAQYRYKVNNYIAVNPGVFVVLNPENQDNNAIVVGTIRTIFEF
ncbi:MAG: iron uptake porin [Cyanobacteria bacterium P01_H01_bin.15]